MPQPRRLTDEQEAAALAMNRNGVSVAELARAYMLTWRGMKDCLERGERRESEMVVSRGTSAGTAAA
jgi:hypothetical protein